MKLYYTPGACSIGIHIILEDIAKPYESQPISLRHGEHQTDAFKKINPKSKVPVLALDDGTILTEFLAIASYLATTNPEAHLLPHSPLDQARATEYMAYCNGTMHTHGFARIVRPERFAAPNASPAELDAVRAQGRTIFAEGFTTMSHALADRDFLLGPYSIADAALFYVTYWAETRKAAELPANIAAHYARMKARPAVQRTFALEGLT